MRSLVRSQLQPPKNFELFILEGWFSKPFTYHNRRRESCDAGAGKQVSIRVLDGTSNINNQFRRTRAWCMGWTVNPWLAEFDTQMRSQTIWAVGIIGNTLALHAGVRGSNPRRSTNFNFVVV